MRRLATILILSLLARCTVRFVPTITEQARLAEVHKMKGGRDSLILYRMVDSSRLVVMHRSYSTVRTKFEIGAWYTIQHDTTKYRIVEGCKRYEARIKKNQ